MMLFEGDVAELMEGVESSGGAAETMLERCDVDIGLPVSLDKSDVEASVAVSLAVAVATAVAVADTDPTGDTEPPNTHPGPSGIDAP